MQGMGSANPLNDEPPEPPPFEFGDRALIVLPGISWDEWVSLWRTAEGMHQSSNFYMGDALLAGQREFGERFAQVVDPKYIHAQRGAMWVCSRIEPARRKASLSFSLHRELASLDPAEQDRWLDLAEAGQWTVKDLKEEIEAERARQHNGPPPDDAMAKITPAPDESLPCGSTWNEDSTFGTPEDIDGRPVLVALDGGKARAAGDGAAPPPPATQEPPLPVSPEEIRALIAAIRRIANDIALGTADPQDVTALEWDIYRATDTGGLNTLTSYERAIDLIPKPWRGKFTVEFGEHVFGGRAYSVDLRKPGGRQMAAGHGPSLPCAIAEAALSALLSDLGTD